MLIVFFFRKARPKNLRESRINKAMKQAVEGTTYASFITLAHTDRVIFSTFVVFRIESKGFIYVCQQWLILSPL